jgi:putative transposase
VPYWRLFYHVVWSTRNREPLICPDIERTVWGIIRDAAGRHGMIVHAIGGIEDHVHVALSIPPNTSLSAAIGKLKGASSTEINRRSLCPPTFSWQGDYSVMSFAERSLPEVQAYIKRQREHHFRGNLHNSMEPVSRNAGGSARE